jgi:hypothetical protein
MTRNTSVGRIVAVRLASLLLLGATDALAGGRMERASLQPGQQAALGLGDSKCIMVGEVLKCVPTVVASS